MRERVQPAGATSRLLLFAAVGVAAGLGVFGAETVLVMRSSHALLQVDGSGVASAALTAARPAIEKLLLRIAVAYAAMGASSA